MRTLRFFFTSEQPEQYKLWSCVIYLTIYIGILKAIKNATGTSVIFPINISFIHFVFVLTSAPIVGERFTKTLAQLHTSVKNFGEK